MDGDGDMGGEGDTWGWRGHRGIVGDMGDRVGMGTGGNVEGQEGTWGTGGDMGDKTGSWGQEGTGGDMRE